jgi:transcriptional regulator with XRE-family HTH domain
MTVAIDQHGAGWIDEGVGDRFCLLLRQYRVRAGLSQNALARQAGVDPAYINRLERQTTIRTHPSRRVILSIADVLDLSRDRTDDFLYAAGLAPTRDWRAIADRAMVVMRERLDTLTLDEVDRGRHPAIIATR